MIHVGRGNIRAKLLPHLNGSNPWFAHVRRTIHLRPFESVPTPPLTEGRALELPTRGLTWTRLALSEGLVVGSDGKRGEAAAKGGPAGRAGGARLWGARSHARAAPR